MRDLDDLWAAAKVRGLVWRAVAVIEALQRMEVPARPPVKTLKRREPRPRRAG